MDIGKRITECRKALVYQIQFESATGIFKTGMVNASSCFLSTGRYQLWNSSLEP